MHMKIYFIVINLGAPQKNIYADNYGIKITLVKKNWNGVEAPDILFLANLRPLNQRLKHIRMQEN